ncbi:nucleoside hydrolase [Xanthomonas vesicatoria]|uniref:nucleoside hydrolase n=1 Tax=Xanthomonas vesicatoria TaxID=56460 RepID=UPI000732275E|nr:nucleoside hydrolase [Xanthomonas vesicatoria]KTF38837.1 nucleoside hydrolase [Xanthomonas vesicatoria]MCC8560145.1 nucleoside hydrolase [Xanthomonas vesicatoria]MCC8616529.1 nucleoside hydrolase [Xanthomonas vesicatoria]MCC8630740.1 nucleoside hydrolase [Xanthomonas vesicatoria]MCC8673718.1 nucleoside hydrolase [Xanthomonas vesicatoria]
MQWSWQRAWMMPVMWCVCAAAWAQTPAAAVQGAAAPVPADKVVVSTDIGDDIDDAFALALLLRRPQVQVLGIASAWGDTTLRAQLLQRLLQQAGRSDISLAVGKPTTSTIAFSQARWAAKGQLSSGLPDAAAMILQQARRHPGQVTLLVLGPMTDAALAQQRDPAGFAKLKRIVAMGGSVRVGYGKSAYRPASAPAAEYNIVSDVPAAQRVFAAGVPIVLLPLDATQITLEEPERIALFAHGDGLTDALTQLYYQWRNTDQPWASATPTVFDAVPVAWLLRPALCPTTPLHLDVDAQGYTREGPGVPNVQACLRADKPALIDMYMQAVLQLR